MHARESIFQINFRSWKSCIERTLFTFCVIHCHSFRQHSLVLLLGGLGLGSGKNVEGSAVGFDIKEEERLINNSEVEAKAAKMWMKSDKKSLQTSLTGVTTSTHTFEIIIDVTIRTFQFPSGYLLYCQQDPILKEKVFIWFCMWEMLSSSFVSFPKCVVAAPVIYFWWCHRGGTLVSSITQCTRPPWH